MDKVIKDIRCNACNCVHHADDYKCTAGHIEIGNTSACSCQDTLRLLTRGTPRIICRAA